MRAETVISPLTHNIQLTDGLLDRETTFWVPSASLWFKTAVTMEHFYTKSMMIGLAIAFFIIPLVFVCLRLWAKQITKRIGWDDYLTIAALVS